MIVEEKIVELSVDVIPSLLHHYAQGTTRRFPPKHGVFLQSSRDRSNDLPWFRHNRRCGVIDTWSMAMTGAYIGFPQRGILCLRCQHLTRG